MRLDPAVNATVNSVQQTTVVPRYVFILIILILSLAAVT